MKIVSSFHKPGIKCIFLIVITHPITGREEIKDYGHLKLLSTKFWSNLITYYSALESRFLKIFCQHIRVKFSYFINQEMSLDFPPFDSTYVQNSRLISEPE